MKNKGFTLIELLVVISIISILSSVVLTTIKVAKEKAYSARNKTSINTIATALELYRLNNGELPQANPTWLPFPNALHSGFITTPNCNANVCWNLLPVELPKMPIPQNNDKGMPNCLIPAACQVGEKFLYWYVKPCPDAVCANTMQNIEDTDILLAPIKNPGGAPVCVDSTGTPINNPRKLSNAMNCQDVNTGCVLDGGWQTGYSWICKRLEN